MLAGHGAGGVDVIDGWDVRRLLAVVYYLATENMDKAAREDFDAALTDGETPTTSRALFAALAGGEEIANGRITH